MNPVSSTGQAMAEVEFSALSPASAGGSPARRPSRGKSRRRSRSATPPRPPSIDGSTPGTPEPNFIIETRLYPDPLSRPMEAASDISLGFTVAGYSSSDHTDLDSGEANSYIAEIVAVRQGSGEGFSSGFRIFRSRGRGAAAGCEGRGSHDDKKHEPRASSRRQLPSNKKNAPSWPGSVPGGKRAFCIFGSGGWTRTNDLRVMSPTSCHCSTPRR